MAFSPDRSPAPPIEEEPMITSNLPQSALQGRGMATPVTEASRVALTFEDFASEWLERQNSEGGRAGTGLSTKSRQDLEWRLSRHLLPAFGSKLIYQISVRDVDQYRLEKVRDEHLMPSSINKTLSTLAAILELAVEYELIHRNPAQGRRRRLRTPPPQRSWLDRADHIAALLDGARDLDESARVQRGQRRALLATLTFAGLRLGEALALRWRDVDLERGTIVVRAAKTDAGMRSINVLPVLFNELADLRARRESSVGSLLFGTTNGRPLGPSNVRRRILAKAIERANVELDRAMAEPLPKHLTPHSLRRTFASLLFALGEAPPYVMAQMGHTSANLTLSIYARQMDRRDGESERLRALVEGDGRGQIV
jgi:integrase